MTASRPAAVVVLAAGEGTRMRSAAPKVLHRIGGRSLLGHAMAAARALGPERLAVVVRHERDRVAAHVLEVDPDAVVADQDDIKGTGRAVACGLPALADPAGAPLSTGPWSSPTGTCRSSRRRRCASWWPATRRPAPRSPC